MQKITRLFIDQLLSTVSILEFMESEYDSEFVNGSNNWANTNCPMPNHDDSSPSFGVNVADNKYNCFGCGQTGDIIKLVQQVEGLNFVESIQRISDFAGVDIEIVNLDIKYLIKELSSTINDYFSKENISKYPGGLSEGAFLIAFSERTKKYEKYCSYDETECNWIEEIYKSLERDIDGQNFKNIDKLWKNFSKMTRERKVTNEI
jgi:hypothetical protein